MILETTDEFSFEHKQASDAAHKATQQWEQLMWKYQQPLPTAKPGQKWMVMDQIYDLK
jgi:L-rhamnose mutarotase